MDRLVIPIAAVGGGAHVQATIPFADVLPRDAEPLPLEHVTVEGHLTPAADDFLFSGKLYGEFVHPCDRCLKPMRHPFSVEVFWTFEEGPALTELERMMRDDENLGGIWTFQGVELDLRLPVYDECVLAAPTKFVCSETCAGLCPECGQPLNEHERPCPGAAQEEPIANNAFSGLAEMFPDLAPRKHEE
ncbi:MAG: DUF177 domain-containing protein [Candidatus Hydrogenedentes bacterium]|nr:DUF177 domain-containing protein [Candidatus Hydrogenedentota bacterium]